MATAVTTSQELRLAECMSRLGTESAFEVLVRARALEATGREVIHLEIGEPDFPTALHIVQAAAEALRNGWTHYGPSAGLPELRAAVAEDAGRRRGISIDPSEVVITPGGKPVMFFAILALVDRDDEVIYPNPGFPIYESMINFVGGRAVPYGFREGHDFDVDVGEIIDKVTDRTRLVILNSPHNPTGGVIPRESVAELARELAERDLFILSDEIYSRLVYEGEHASIAQFPGMKERTIILDGFSKTYAMTGWRLGYGIMRADLAQKVAQLQTNATSCTASFTRLPE
jgi:aspartate aminotransferase